MPFTKYKNLVKTLIFYTPDKPLNKGIEIRMTFDTLRGKKRRVILR